jgi:hypothetical protein
MFPVSFNNRLSITIIPYLLAGNEQPVPEYAAWKRWLAPLRREKAGSSEPKFGRLLRC